MTRSLLDMPKVVMTKIMEDIGIKAMMTLRKVCHDLRNFMNDVKPDAKLEEITINETSKSIIVRYEYSGETNFAKYTKHEEGCLVNNSKPDDNYWQFFGNIGNGEFLENIGDKKGILLKNEEIVNIFLKDFEIVLGHQKSILKVFRLNEGHEWNGEDEEQNLVLMENLHRILQSRVCPLKTKSFNARLMDETQIISILSSLDTRTLSDLDLGVFEDGIIRIDQLAELDQWKNAQHVRFTSPIDYKYAQHFTHFSEVTVIFKTDHFPDLVSLKNTFIQFNGFQTIHMRPINHDNNNAERLEELLSKFTFDDEFSRYLRYYHIPATNNALKISAYHEDFRSNDMRIELSRIEETNVPSNAVIHS